MKKFLLGVTAFLSLFACIAMPDPAYAHDVEGKTTIHIAAGGAECSAEGYISPKELSFNYGRYINVIFENEQPTKLEIRDFPGGNFTVAGSSSAEKSFQAKKDFTYSAWLDREDCKKAEAKVTVGGGGFVRQTLPWIVLLGGGAIAFFFIQRNARQHSKAASKPREDK